MTTHSTGPNARTIRVFISSTFRDMKQEREILVKHIFPQLRKLCEQRGVTWSDVDLRWGITQEQSEHGEVLPICLAEIERCRPYFIGLLGERYGWVPDEIPQELIDQQPWLKNHLKRSATELEILHGVLNNPEMANRACFYFRDPAYVEKVPHNKRSDFIDKDPGKRAKLDVLKESIHKSGLAVHENYADPKTLGELVLHDITAVINQKFPAEKIPDPLDREAADHEAFATSRFGIYIGGEKYFERLDEHVAGNGPPLVILGESGSGKSALLANWIKQYREAHKDDCVLMHFIGGTPHSAEWAAMLRRLMGELKRRFDIEQEIPSDVNDLRTAFPNWLHMASAKAAQRSCRIVLVIDALNQLEDRDGAPDLVWLPPVMPENVRLLLSTLPGRSLEEITKRDWTTLTVEPLTTDERRQLIRDVLKLHTKELSPERVERIATSAQASNPLFLRALLEELRVFGIHERLDERIDHYLGARTIPDLYERVLARFEEDYEHDRPGLVGEAMSLIWASRRGLSEVELLDLLGRDDEPLPRMFWSPLFLAAEQSLVVRFGLIGFFHDYMRQAVHDKYLSSPSQVSPEHKRTGGFWSWFRKTPAYRSRSGRSKGEARSAGWSETTAHLRLADYFENQAATPRRTDELPWQLAQAGSWRALYDLLSDLPFFGLVWEVDEYDARAYWARIEQHSHLSMEDAYKPVLSEPHRHEEWIYQLYDLFQFSGHLDGAMELMKQEEQICRELGNKDGLSASLCNQAVILQARGDLDGAMELYKQQEHIFRELGNKDSLSISLGNQAVILDARGDLDGAMELHKQEEQICRELGNKGGLSTSLGNQATIFYSRGDLDGAMELHKQEEQICRELGNKGGLSASLGSQAVILDARSDLDGAMELHKQEEQICRELGNMDGLSASLGNQATIFYSRGDLDGAMDLYKQVERICRELGSKEGLAISLSKQAVLLASKLNRPREALPLAEESYRLATEHGLLIKSILEYIMAPKELQSIENYVRQALQTIARKNVTTLVVQLCDDLHLISEVHAEITKELITEYSEWFKDDTIELIGSEI